MLGKSLAGKGKLNPETGNYDVSLAQRIFSPDDAARMEEYNMRRALGRDTAKQAEHMAYINDVYARSAAAEAAARKEQDERYNKILAGKGAAQNLGMNTSTMTGDQLVDLAAKISASKAVADAAQDTNRRIAADAQTPRAAEQGRSEQGEKISGSNYMANQFDALNRLLGLREAAQQREYQGAIEKSPYDAAANIALARLHADTANADRSLVNPRTDAALAVANASKAKAGLEEDVANLTRNNPMLGYSVTGDLVDKAGVRLRQGEALYMPGGETIGIPDQLTGNVPQVQVREGYQLRPTKSVPAPGAPTKAPAGVVPAEGVPPAAAAKQPTDQDLAGAINQFMQAREQQIGSSVFTQYNDALLRKHLPNATNAFGMNNALAQKLLREKPATLRNFFEQHPTETKKFLQVK